MSLNLILYAQRWIIVEKTGKREEQYLKLELWQTPTEVTIEVLKSSDRSETYYQYFKKIIEDFNTLTSHIECLYFWISDREKEGYEISWEYI
jgi:hypothetical protein